jgi:uncharacterized protein
VTPADVVVLFLAGAAAAFINTVAGAGSLISLRVLMLLGVPAVVANGTNRLPVLVQSVVAYLGFRRANVVVEPTELRRVVLYAGVGSLVGAVASSFVPEEAMRTILIFVLFGVAVVSLFGLRKKKAKEDGAPAIAPASYVPWLILSGAYGGFLQAGVGLLLLYALMDVRGLDALKANLIKAAATAVFAVIALTVFVVRGQFDAPKALALSAGAFAGALLGVRFAARYVSVLRYVAVVADFVACVVLLYREWAG